MVNCQAPVKYILWPYGKEKQMDCIVYDSSEDLIMAVRKEYAEACSDGTMIIEEVIYRRTMSLVEEKPPVYLLTEVYQ